MSARWIGAQTAFEHEVREYTPDQGRSLKAQTETIFCCLAFSPVVDSGARHPCP
jgi:hypothetical protein